MKIIKFNQSKSAQGGTRTLGGNGGGIYTNTTPAPSVNLEPYALKTQILWEKGEGNNSVIEKTIASKLSMAMKQQWESTTKV